MNSPNSKTESLCPDALLSDEYLSLLKQERSKESIETLRKLYTQEWPVDPERGSGRTTKQIKKLDDGGTFVVIPSARNYTIHLLRYLRRTDVRVVSYEAMTHYHGPPMVDLAVDHAVWDYLAEDRRWSVYYRLRDAVNNHLDYIAKRKAHHGKR